jgi:hypothetical protein
MEKKAKVLGNKSQIQASRWSFSLTLPVAQATMKAGHQWPGKSVTYLKIKTRLIAQIMDRGG